MKKLTFELGWGTEAECGGARVAQVGQAAEMEGVLGSDEHVFKSYLHHFLSDLEYNIEVQFPHL